jgi:prepilin-type N-terminal cleavage/methylation domain-containing protein
MKTMKKQSGFTLVEIAIVLVVIGLLLGGILKGQQLINSARVRNMADQNSGVQAAYFGFIDRYRQIPGDMTPTDACTAIGSIVDPNCGGAPTIGGDRNGRVDQWEEAGAVWAHLSAAGYLNGTFGGVTTDSGTYLAGVLTGDVPGNAFQRPIMLAYTNDYEAGAGTPTIRLAFAFGSGIQPPLLRELDVKLDDGQAATGVMRPTVDTVVAGETGDDFGASLIWDGSGGSGPDCVNNAGANNASYNVDSDNETCNAVYLF